MQLPVVLLTSAVLAFSLYGCNSRQPAGGEPIPRDISIWPRPANPLRDDPAMAYEKQITAILDQLTLQQKVGQMVQPQLDNITPAEVRDYHVGSVLAGGNAYANNDKYASAADWVNVVDAYYKASMDKTGGRVAIPITWGIDAVHGHNKIVGATVFPHNIGLGATRNPDLLRRIGQVTAKEMLVTGIDWTFAPSVSVVRDDRWGRTYEGFSEDPELVALLTKPYIEGLQGVAGTDSFMNADHVMATAKHFIGDGGTQNGVDRGDTQVSEAELYRVHSAGYVEAVQAGVLSIMASHSLWQGERLHGHRYLLTDVLKERMGFDGFIVGDWNSHELVEGCSADSCPQAVNAGLDMFMVTEDWEDFIDNTVEQVRSGVIPESRVDDAVTRILRAKFRAGLFEKGPPSERKYAYQSELLGAPEHRAVARQAVRESLVLLKNNNSLLPLDPGTHVLVAGDGADNIGKQSGGWTVTWRGTGTTNADFPSGESILAGIRGAVKPAGGTVTYNEKGEYATKPDVAVVVFGEEPYAEWFGDIEHLSYQHLSDRDAKLLERLKADNIPVVSLFISGRPLWVNRHINASEAFVAVWLPGTEGGGIADVIFRTADGSVNHDFTGTLSFSWPMYPSQSPLNRGDDRYEPLFPYGYGLSYQDDGNLRKLTVREDLPDKFYDPTLQIFEGRAAVPWYAGIIDDEGFTFYPGGSIRNRVMTMREADRNTQGDAVALEWLGGGRGTMSIAGPEESKDYTSYVDERSALIFDLNVESQPTGPVYLLMGDFRNPTGIEMTAAFHRLAPDEWRTVSVDLACFAERGVDFGSIGNAFSLSTSGRLKMRLADIRIVPDTADAATISCAE